MCRVRSREKTRRNIGARLRCRNFVPLVWLSREERCDTKILLRQVAAAWNMVHQDRGVITKPLARPTTIGLPLTPSASRVCSMTCSAHQVVFACYRATLAPPQQPHLPVVAGTDEHCNGACCKARQCSEHMLACGPSSPCHAASAYPLAHQMPPLPWQLPFPSTYAAQVMYCLHHRLPKDLSWVLHGTRPGEATLHARRPTRP